MLKKASFGNSAAQISTAIVESNTLITYTTVDIHSIFEGAKVTVTGITATTGVSPNVTNALVYKVNSATSFSVKPNSDFTYAEAFPRSLTVGADATAYSINGSLMSSTMVFAQPEQVVRPTYFNFISPEISLVASGNGVLVTWDATGVSNPQASISVERILGTSSTVISTAATSVVSSTIPYLLDGSLTAGTSYTYKVTALNSVSSQINMSEITTLVISAISPLTAVAKENTANTVSLSWTAPETEAAISQYEISRSSNGGSSWSALATTSSSVFSYDDGTATADGSTAYTYRIRAKAAYAVEAGGDIYSSYTSSSAILPYFISTTTPTAATVASTANRLLVSWSAVSAAYPAVTRYELQRASSGNNSTWSEWSSLTLSSLTATSYSDTAASSGLYYKYRIRVVNSQLTSAYVESNSLQAFYLSDPLTPAPTVTRASTSNTNLVLSGIYSANPIITSYEIRRSKTSGSTWDTIAASATATTSGNLLYTDSTTEQDTTFIYQVRATNGELTTGNWSTSSTPVLTYAVPSAPTSVSAFSQSSTTINVSWNAAATNAAGPAVLNYRVDYKLASDSTWTTASNAISSGARSYTVGLSTPLTTDASYNFRVLAINAIGTSPASSTATATPVRINDFVGAYLQILGGTLTPSFNTTSSFYASTRAGRTVKLQVSSTGVGDWTDLTSYTSSGVNYPNWLVNTTDVRYFRLYIAQDATYFETISNVLTLDPVPGALIPLFYSASLADQSSVEASGLTSTTRTVTIEVIDDYGQLVPGATVTWYKTQYGNTSAVAINTGTTATTGVNLGRATLDITAEVNAGRITGSTSFEIQATISKTNYITNTYTNNLWYYDIYVYEYITNASPSHGYSYKDNGGVRGDNSTFRLYTGRYDSSWGMQKSAIGWTGVDWDKIDSAAEVVSGSLRLYRGNGAGTNPGTAYLGTHEDSGTLSSDFDTIPGKALRLQSFSISDNQDLTIGFNQAMLDQIVAAGVRGILIGPPSSTSLTYYMWFYGVTSGSPRPLFSLKYAVIPTWSLP